MAYERELHQMLMNFTSQYGKLKEVILTEGSMGGKVELKFENGSVSNPPLMKCGYIGTGTQCLYTFLREAGFPVTLDELQQPITESKTLRSAE
jgi:hypothetical protein